jgi:hypothetical protein
MVVVLLGEKEAIVTPFTFVMVADHPCVPSCRPALRPFLSWSQTIPVSLCDAPLCAPFFLSWSQTTPASRCAAPLCAPFFVMVADHPCVPLCRPAVRPFFVMVADHPCVPSCRPAVRPFFVMVADHLHLKQLALLSE